MRPNRRATALQGSATLALDARAKALIAQGIDVINMAVGEPDFPAPAAIRAAAEEAVRGGDVRYTPAAGRASLRQAVARHLKATRGVDFSADEVVVCHSAKHALSNALQVLVEADDEVLLFRPVWSSYSEAVRIAGGVPVEVDPRDDLGPDFDAIRAAITPATRGLMLNTPTNPSGYVWTEEEVRRLAEIAEEADLWMLTDEIYRRLVYEGEPNFSPVSISDAARARTVVVDGASKAYAMTGYRIGFLAAPVELARAVTRLQSQTTGCPNAVSQSAYETALLEEPPEVTEMCAEFARRRGVLVDGLVSLGLPTPRPRGAYYAFPDVSAYLDDRGSDGFCEDLLEERSLAVVPGSAFGRDRCVRLSYSTSIENCRGALERLGEFLAKRR